MKDKRKSKLTAGLLIAAVVLLLGSGIGGARAAFTAESQDYRAWFYLNHLQVHLIENGRDVCNGENDLNGENKVTGELVQYLGYSAGDEEGQETPGTVEPGRIYKEEIAARNGQDIPQYVRLTVRKYWVDTATGEKTTMLSPGQIHLTYGDKPYNDEAWQLNEQETTTESATYYLTKELAANADSEPLFDRLMIDEKVAEIGDTIESKEGNKTIYTYVYKYDGYAFYIEADVQAIQTHNAEDAIHSQWGVYNVTAGDGVLTVEE